MMVKRFQSAGGVMVALLLELSIVGCWLSGSIHSAALEGKKDVVQRWLALGGDIQEKDARGFSALHCAAEGGHVEIAELLLSKGAEVNAKNDLGNTPLHEAAWKGRLQVVQLLLSKGADPRIRALDGKTAIDLARKNVNSEIADFLASYQASASSAVASQPLEPEKK